MKNLIVLNISLLFLLGCSSQSRINENETSPVAATDESYEAIVAVLDSAFETSDPEQGLAVVPEEANALPDHDPDRPVYQPASTRDVGVTDIDDEVELHFETNLDSLLQLWYIRQSPRIASHLTERDTSLFPIPEFHDSVYIKRLSNIPSVIDLSYNNVVKAYIGVYTKNRRGQMEVMLGLTDYYFPMFEEVLDQYGLPLELRYLPVIESALNPRAVSRAKATGMWQFMFGTARMYNLNMNSLVDERRDPLASSHAAARYLRDLHGIYKDWTLALAAYNCGPGNVNRAIRRAGGARNYWAIYNYLPRETRGYVPAFVAATYAMHYYDEHKLVPIAVDFPVYTDTIMIHQEMHLMQISEVLDIPVEMLRDMNPQYLSDIIPARDRSYSLRLPVDYSSRFIDNIDSISAHRADLYLNRANLTAGPLSSTAAASVPSGRSPVHYTVKSGDNLGVISRWYNVSVANLRSWNNIRGNIIRPGQRLVIHVPSSQTDYFNAVNSLSFAQKQARVGRTPATNQPSTALTPDGSGEFLYYTVRQGDTLWEIARQFPGVTDRDILRLNELSNANRIYPGQRLRIKRGD
ncbi:MAG: LysM peptidoglycan-binding domain-containing protein [Bacteroidales bacterium]